jgi:hypothetical protein
MNTVIAAAANQARQKPVKLSHNQEVREREYIIVVYDFIIVIIVQRESKRERELIYNIEKNEYRKFMTYLLYTIGISS